MNRRWHGPRYLSDPEITAILTGIFRNGDKPRYFRIIDSKCQWVGVKRALTDIGVGHSTITSLLKLAVETGLIKVGRFEKDKYIPKPRIKKEKVSKVNDRVTDKSATRLKPEPKPRPAKPKPQPRFIIIDHSADDPEPEEAKPRHVRYSLIQRGEFFGWYDAQFGEVRLISRNPKDARDEIRRLNKPDKMSTYLPRCKELDSLIYGGRATEKERAGETLALTPAQSMIVH